MTELLKLERPLISLDVETHSKVPPEHAHIVELGFKIDYPDGREPKRWVSFIKPPVPITDGAIGVHNITNEMVAEAPTWRQIGPNIAKGFTDCDYAGYNVRFDLRVIQAEMHRIGLHEWSYASARILDGFRIWQIAVPRSLSHAVEEFCGRKPTEAHRALGDAEDAFDAIVGQLKRFPHLPRDIQQLHDLCFKDPTKLDAEGKIAWVGTEAAINFGKHAGTLLKNVPRSYLMWMQDNSFPEDVKKIIAEALDGKFPKKETNE